MWHGVWWCDPERAMEPRSGPRRVAAPLDCVRSCTPRLSFVRRCRVVLVPFRLSRRAFVSMPCISESCPRHSDVYLSLAVRPRASGNASSTDHDVESTIVIGRCRRRVGTRILGRAYSDLRAPLRSYTIGLAWPLRMRGRTTIWSGRNEMNLCCKDDVGWVSL